MRSTIPALCLALAAAPLATPAAALGPLKEVTHVREGVISAGIAYEIGRVCGSLDARILRGISFLEGLKSHARGLGYSSAEINAYLDDRAEKRALEAEARSRLAAKGAVSGQPETYCAVGRAEMAAGSDIGRLLR